MTDDVLPPEPLLPTPHRHWYRPALGTTILLVLAVLAMLPVAVRSMQDVDGFFCLRAAGDTSTVSSRPEGLVGSVVRG